MKRLQYTKDELDRVYERIVRTALSHEKRKRYNRAIATVEKAAKMQYSLNFIYADERLNGILREQSIIFYGINESYVGNPNVVLFYDSFAIDNGGLTQQYLDALVSCTDLSIVYICEEKIKKNGKNILKFLQSHNISYFELPKDHDGACCVFKGVIDRLMPGKMFLHTNPYTTVPYLIGYSYPNIKKYKINLTDHAFWIGGADFFNKILEFRDYGATLSIEKRGFNYQQIKIIPFYPWQEEMDFEGFPPIKQRTLLFSGGATYKIESKDRVFFKIVEKILDCDEDVAFLYAGNGNMEHLEKYKHESKHKDRIFYLGFRKDIAQVMRNIDIYLNTYPFAGGLMLQFAATSSKPILSMRDGSCEALVCTKRNASFAFDRVDELVEEASRLIKDKKYREERALFFHSLISTKDDFKKMVYNKCFSTSYDVDEHINQEKIDYEGVCNMYLNNVNNGHKQLMIEQNIIRASLMAVNWKMVMNCIVFGSAFLLKRFKIKRNG